MRTSINPTSSPSRKPSSGLLKIDRTLDLLHKAAYDNNDSRLWRTPLLSDFSSGVHAEPQYAPRINTTVITRTWPLEMTQSLRTRHGKCFLSRIPPPAVRLLACGLGSLYAYECQQLAIVRYTQSTGYNRRVLSQHLDQLPQPSWQRLLQSDCQKVSRLFLSCRVRIMGISPNLYSTMPPCLKRTSGDITLATALEIWRDVNPMTHTSATSLR
jgi:hypothetical protein